MAISRGVSGWPFPAIAFAAMLIGAPPAALAQLASPADYPNRPIRIVVPLPPGATADTLPRIIGEKLTLKWGQPVVIENRPGAAQNLGAEVVSRAEPDGYTLLATPQGPLVISQHFYSKLAFDPAALVPVTVMGVLPYVLVVNPKIPFANVPELIAYAKANPDKLTYASPGTGSSTHLAMEWLKTLGHIRMTHVPYRGAAPALTDLLAGHVDMMFDNLGNVLELIKDGRLRAIAVSTERPIAELLGVEPVAKTFSGFTATSWFAIVAPPKTPPAIAAKLSAAIGDILRLPDVEKRLRDLAATPSGISPAKTAALIETESAQWQRIMQDAGIKPE